MPSTRPGLPEAPLHEVVAGMPQLALHGLSENWLLKECGDRHWRMLADAFGLPQPAFRDRDGNRLYATFTGLSVTEARLDRVAEHDRLRFHGQVGRVSRTQYQSVQRVAVGDRRIATVAMVSAFLRRAVPGDNRSVLRALPHPFPLSLAPLSPAAGTVAADPQAPLPQLCQRFRREDWQDHRGFRRADRLPLGEVAIDQIAIDPCPHRDFNGAGFLYFAAFQAFLDQAEWALFRARGPGLVTTGRDLFYYGNINPGDRLGIGLCGVRQDGDRLSHWFEIRRASDGARIAEGFTERRAVSNANFSPLPCPSPAPGEGQS